MKKNNMLRGIVKLIGATLLMCFVGLFLCKTEALAYDVEMVVNADDEEIGFYLIRDTDPETGDEPISRIDVHVNGTAKPYTTLSLSGAKSNQILFADVVKNAQSKGIEFKNGESMEFKFYDGSGNVLKDFDGISTPAVYDLLESVKLDPESATAIGNLYLDNIILSSSQRRYYLEGEEIKSGVKINFSGSDFTNKVSKKYFIRPDDDVENSKWNIVTDSYTTDRAYIAGEEIDIFFRPVLSLSIYASASNTENLKYDQDVELTAHIFANEDEEGTSSYEGYKGYDGIMEWWCDSESGVNTRCYPIDEADGEYAKSSTHYVTEGLTGNKFIVSVIPGSGQEGNARWRFLIPSSNLSGYPALKNPDPADVYVDFVYQKTGLQLYNNGQPLASGGEVYATEGNPLTTVSVKTTDGSSLTSYSNLKVTRDGVLAGTISSDGRITISSVASSGTYVVSGDNSQGETETLEFIVRVSGKPVRVEIYDDSDAVTSGLTLRLNDSNLIFYDKNDNILKGVALKTAIVADEDVLEVKKDNSGVYLVGDEPGTTEVELVLADGTVLEDILEITVYPMPTLTYESNRSLKVGMPYKVAIPGSKDSLKQVTGFKLYVYHDDDKLGEFDMSDMGLSSFSSSAKDSTGTRTLTVSAGAVEKIITNLANNGRFSGDSMGITFKAVPIGKRKSGGSTTYETNKDKVYGEDSTTVYRVGISVAGCTVTQSSRYGLSGQEISFTSDQSSTNWTGVGTGGSTTTGSTAKYTVGTNTTTNLALKATANGSSNGSTSPVQPGTNSGGANGTGAGADGLDDVPKTSESNAPMWLIVIVVLAAIGGAYALYLQLRPVTEMGYYDEDEEDRPNF